MPLRTASSRGYVTIQLICSHKTKLSETEPGLSMRFNCVVAQKLAKLLISLAPPDPKNLDEPVSPKPEVPPWILRTRSNVSQQTLPDNSSIDSILSTKFGLENEVVIKRMCCFHMLMSHC